MVLNGGNELLIGQEVSNEQVERASCKKLSITSVPRSCSLSYFFPWPVGKAYNSKFFKLEI